MRRNEHDKIMDKRDNSEPLRKKGTHRTYFLIASTRPTLRAVVARLSRPCASDSSNDPTS